ncbi:serine/threonine-protein kinase pim-2-like isoform X1 [Pimephales promelas]|uniref:serine/threonine-protein kinase pim-2-like isoform X1 n=1 Tax=Pimephales promelas TaxID=90988 RepID=UPI0019556ADA|nr:serine/threonine-protein kinase pim-2-like isoform X1 [Pimephales promelas]
MAHIWGRGGRSRSRRADFTQTAGQEVWRPVSDDRGPAHWRKEGQSGTQRSPDDGRPSTSSKHSRRDSSSSLSLSEDNVERRFCRESLRLSSRGSYSVVWRWSGDVSESQSEQDSGSSCGLSRSDSWEGWLCPPLPGQVAEEPSETSRGRTARSAMESSPVNKSSTGKPTRKRKRFGRFLHWLWKAMKGSFCCRCHSCAVDVVEPFVPPADLEPEPEPDPTSPRDPDPTSPPDPDPTSPPDTDLSGVEPNNESFESLYEAGAMIGCGTFGSVYRGTRKLDGKRVAIKRMRKCDNFHYLDIPGHPEPLITEVALLLMMRREPISPYVIQLYEWFEHPRKFSLIMEFPEPCESLKDFITRRDPDVCETIARVFTQQAVLAVQHCIEHGVFHNDVHAQNFLLKRNSLDLKLIDFGCGQLFSSEGYESDIYLGRNDHCPPEVFTEPRFHAVPANVWALGVMLYEMLNGSCPFQSRTEVIEAKVTFPNSNLSRECSDLIRQCLARDPAKRPTLEQMSQHTWIRNDLL